MAKININRRLNKTDFSWGKNIEGKTNFLDKIRYFLKKRRENLKNL